MDQQAGTGHSPVHHDYGAEQRYALTNAGHAVLAPTGDAPAPGVVLSCTDCDHVYEPTAADLAAGPTGCPDPDCGGWTVSSALTVVPAAGSGS